MRIRRTVRQVLFIIFAVSLLLSSGCSSEYERSGKPMGDWSRGLLLGESNIKQSVALETDAEQDVHMLWVESPSEDVESLRYARLSKDGQVSINRALAIDLPFPRKPQLLIDQSGNVHLALLSRSDGEQALYHARIDDTGEAGELSRLSTAGEAVESFQMFLSPDGTPHFIWANAADAEEPGIYTGTLLDGDTPSPSLLVPDGIDPFVLIDGTASGENARTHLVWTYRTGFSARAVYYAELEDDQLTPSGGQRLATFNYAESATYQPPVIGLDSEKVYVIWSVQNLGGGLTPTAADTFYVTFPIGEPRLFDPINVKLPLDHRPNYDPHSGAYTYNELAPLSSDVYSTDFINAPAVVSRQRGELPVAVSLIIESASKQFMQLALTVFEDGEPTGYQIANETSNASVLPTMVADAEGNLHLAWLDTAGFRRYKVYYATTAPEPKAWLDRTTIGDIGGGAASLAWGILSAIGFLPLTLMWNAPALVWLVLFYLLARQEYLDQLAAKIALGVSFAIYLTVKMLFLPGLLSAGTPFVYLVPESIASTMTTMIPILILLLASLGVFIYLRRRKKGEPPALFQTYLVFALIDSALTAILYAPRFFNPRG